jgi:hypothetical protein
MFASPKLVGRRRLKRRLKAAASVIVALAAGSFLACQRQVEKLTGETGPPSPESPGGALGVRVRDAAAPNPVPEALADAQRTKSADAAVDVNEHRKGMPVRDNLLE